MFLHGRDVLTEIDTETRGIPTDAISYLGDRPGGCVMCIGLPPKDKDVVIGDS